MEQLCEKNSEYVFLCLRCLFFFCVFVVTCICCMWHSKQIIIIIRSDHFSFSFTFNFAFKPRDLYTQGYKKLKIIIVIEQPSSDPTPPPRPHSAIWRDQSLTLSFMHSLRLFCRLPPRNKFLVTAFDMSRGCRDTLCLRALLDTGASSWHQRTTIQLICCYKTATVRSNKDGSPCCHLVSRTENTQLITSANNHGRKAPPDAVNK